MCLHHHQVKVDPVVPTTYKEALESPDCVYWIRAMVEELNTLRKLRTWNIVELPEYRRAIGCKWVFKIKRDALGNIIRYKARLVALGYRQKEGLDYKETFAPVARMTSQRLLVSVAAHEDLALYQIDIDNAYLNGDIDTTIFMTQPEGFVDPRFSDTKRYVCELQKGLYGLKQAGNIWHTAIHTYILELGFRPTTGDKCVYTKSMDGSRMLIALHVDDFHCAGKPSQVEWLIAGLKKRYSLKYQKADLCLGLKIDKLPNGGYTISQQHYLEALLKELELQDCKPASTPMTKGEVDALVSGDNGAKPLNAKDHALYRTIVGKLMYAMVGSRPDLAFALSILGRYAAAPDSYHMSLAKRVLKYVKGTITYKLYYSKPKTKTPILLGYVDSDWANSADRKSTTGFAFFLGEHAISWCSKKQPTVATSTTVAEYIALYEVSTETRCLRTLLAEVKIPQAKATIIKEDNQTAIRLAEDDASHKRTKHIDVKYHFSKELQDRGETKIEYVPSQENIADFFTKPLPHDQHIAFCKQLGLRP